MTSVNVLKPFPERAGTCADRLRADGWQPWKSGFGELQLFRAQDGPRPVRADVAREPAAMTDDGRLRLWTEVVASRQTLVKVHAATRVPADAGP